MEVELHDGTVLEFPDGTDMAVVKAAVKRYMAKQASSAPEAPAKAPEPPAERTSPVTRFAEGALQTLALGPFQLGTNIGDAINPHLDKVLPDSWSSQGAPKLSEAMAEALRGRKAAARSGMGKDEWDVAGGLGSIAAGLPAVTSKATGLLGRAWEAAKQGAFFGATAPQEEAGLEHNAEAAALGAAVGGAIPVAAEGANMFGKVLYHAGIEPLSKAGRTAIKGRAYLDAAGDKADDVVAALRAYQPAVPGSVAPAGEAAAPAGSTRFAAFQDEAEKVLSDPYYKLGKTRDAARLREIRSIGQDKQALADAVRARKTATSPLYDASDAQMIEDNPALRETLDSIPGAVASRARRLARMRKEPFSIGETKPEEIIETGLLDARGQPITRVEPATKEIFPGRSLSYLQKALRAQQKDPTKGLSSHEQQALAELDDEVGNHLGDLYDTAESTYKDLSVPINQMRVGQFFEKKLTSPLNPEGPSRAGALAQARRDAPATVRSRIGGPRMADITDALTPEQVRKVDAVIQDVAGTEEYKAMAKAGSASGARRNAAQAYTESVDSTGHTGLFPQLIDAKFALANNIIRRLRGLVNDDMAVEIAKELMNPATVADVMETAIARRAKIERTAAALRSGTTRGAALAGGAAAREED